VAPVVDKALAFKPDDRWPDARSMQTACTQALADLAARPTTESDRRLVPQPASTVRMAGQGRRDPLPIVPGRLTTGRAVAASVPEPTMSTPRGLRAVHAALAVVVIGAVASGALIVRARMHPVPAAAPTRRDEPPQTEGPVPGASIAMSAPEPAMTALPSALPPTKAKPSPSSIGGRAPAAKASQAPTAPRTPPPQPTTTVDWHDQRH
jgi:hypothetical protein